MNNLTHKRSSKLLPLVMGVAVVLLGLLPLTALENSDEKNRLEGTWIVESVELGGQDVGGLQGAVLVLADGKKMFTLPDGKVEQGTYSADLTTSPHHIDSTTEGRPGTQPGIFTVDGNTLTMCLATNGDRPMKFSSGQRNDLLLIVLKRDSDSAEPSPQPESDADESDTPSGDRTFRMGFTGFVYDTTLQAVTDSRKFVRENGDILAHHIEGVPWAEALTGEAFPKAVLDSWSDMRLPVPQGGQVYLAISPGRGDLKVQDKAGPLPAELKGKAYDDALVMEAYLNYCRRAIAFFEPDYLAIGIEVNEIHRDGGAATWQAYVTLHKHVYLELKREHPELPIFASWTLHSMFQNRGGMLEEFKKLMPFNDIVGISYYPFFVPHGDRLSALDWAVEQFAEFDKPFAIVETNDTAERLPLPQANVVLEGTPEQQAQYYRKLLSHAQLHEFVFVISFIHQDYDALWERIKDVSPELFKAWRDCGLLDENGNARPAYEVWQQYFSLPLAPAKE